MEPTPYLEEVINAIDSCNNVRSVTYDNDLKKWIVQYRSDLNSDTVETKDLMDFLENA